MNDKFEKLAEPFPPTDIEWRAGATNSDKTKALALAYITSRAVMDRLDNVVGPENWRDEYRPGPNGGVVCGLSIRVGDEWITKWDGADNSDIEGVKGGLSDAFKRAGYKWGIGRYLYNLEGTWIECEVFGKTVRLKGTPKLPAWALPKGTQPAPAKAPAVPPANGKMPAMTLEMAMSETASDGTKYGTFTTEQLKHRKLGLEKALKAPKQSPEQVEEYQRKLTAVLTLIEHHNKQGLPE